jgi:hypothetical protein
MLTRVASPASDKGLLELAGALTASQLERALRAFRRLRSEEAREAQELEYVDYHWGEDGSLFLRARLPAEDGTLLVRALDAARERVRERRRDEGSKELSGERTVGELEERSEGAAREFEPPRSVQVEALVEVAGAALAQGTEGRAGEPARVVVHVDAAALVSDEVDSGRSELDGGPTIPSETALRLGCDAETVTAIEREGLPVSVGRSRRTVPRGLRRLLDARDEGTCCWPGCERTRHLDAHHRTHWARGGETSLDNLVLLCWHHHRLVHEGGYAIEDDPAGRLRFRNRHGVLCPSAPPRSPPASAEALLEQSDLLGLELVPATNRNGDGDPLDLELTVAAIQRLAA